MNIHVVKPGETLMSIAQQYGTTPQRIITDNNFADPNMLTVGQALLILTPDVVHIAKPGDTLGGISVMYNTTILSLLQNNPHLATSPILYAGEPVVVSFSDEKRRSITVNGYAYPYIHRDVLLNSLPYLTTLTIFGYGFDEEGNLIGGIDDQPLINMALEFQTAPIMLLSSVSEKGTFSTELASKLFNDYDMQNKLIEQIIATMKQKKYRGLDVDFEYVRPEDRDAYVQFLENITEKLNAQGFSVNVDLAPKTSADQEGLLYQGHDYAALGDIANTALLMTYEWGYMFGPPIAVAPLNSVRQVVDYGLTEIPADKILLGIPNYGYDWALPFIRGTTAAVPLGNEEALALAQSVGAEIQFDELAQSPFFRYYDDDGKEHVVWFEDARSILGKLNLLSEKQLKGAGYWNLMRPFTQNWLLLNALYDIEKIPITQLSQ
ncbi:MAG: LysM peptidoglycan-binding domain-containing protein [Epulopiscium sp.]|nr:LysM peptidoglycan-binding domain-containing protein [Candidatus Epulonipiscium sp.]